MLFRSEIGRTNWLRDTDWSYRLMEEGGHALPVIEAHCEYQRSAKYYYELDVQTRGTALSAVRVRFDYAIVRCADGVAIAAGYTVHASIGREGRPKRLPERVRALFA